MAMTNEQLTKWIDEIFGTIDEIKQNSGDISGLTRSVRQLREDLTATQADVTDLEDQTAGTVSLPKAQLQYFTDGSATQALDLVADIIPVQAGTGDPSPTNVRAISGYDSVTATTTNDDDTNTATISLGSTVYSGTVNFTTGELTINKAVKTFTGADEEGWTTNDAFAAGVYYTSTKLPDAVPVPGYSTTADITSNLGVSQTAGALTGNTAFGVAQGNTYYVYARLDNDLDTVAKFKTYLGTHNLQILYNLAEPVTTTLTPAQLQLLQGENNVSATSGPITLTYAPDNVLAEVYAYIQKRFDTLTASLAAGRTTRKTTKTLTKKED